MSRSREGIVHLLQYYRIHFQKHIDETTTKQMAKMIEDGNQIRLLLLQLVDTIR